MDAIVRQYNAVEAGLWALFALGFAIEAIRRHGVVRAWAAVLSVAFLAFGFSDYIEMRTGAWWQPIWLLILKVACVGTFIVAGYRYWRAKRSTTQATLASGERRR